MEDKAKLQKAKKLLEQGDIVSARKILEQLPDNPIAKKALEKIQQMNKGVTSSSSSKEKLAQARDLINQKKYDEARVILRKMPSNETAKKWLAKLDEIDPQIIKKRDEIITENPSPSPTSQEIVQTENTVSGEKIIEGIKSTATKVHSVTQDVIKSPTTQKILTKIKETTSLAKSNLKTAIDEGRHEQLLKQIWQILTQLFRKVMALPLYAKIVAGIVAFGIVIAIINPFDSSNTGQNNRQDTAGVPVVSSAQLPHLGVFAVENDGNTEIEESFGGPLDTVLTIDGDTSEFYVWLTEINLRFFGLYKEPNGPSIEFTASQLGRGVLVLRLESNLAAGVYCFSQGDPMLPSASQSHWCFEISGTTEEIASSAIPPENLPIPSDGVFLYTNGELVQIPHQNVETRDDIRRFNTFIPQTINPSPYIFLRLPDEQGLFRLVHMIGGVGIQLSGNIILGIARNGGAAAGGLEQADRFVRIEGRQVNESDSISNLLRGPIGSTVEVSVLRGTSTVDATLTRRIIDSEDVDMSLNPWTSDSVLVRPEFPLEYGRYCVSAGDVFGDYDSIYEPYSRWCFDVVSEITISNIPEPEVIDIPEEVTIAISETISDGDIASTAILGVKYQFEQSSVPSRIFDIVCVSVDNFQTLFPDERPILEVASFSCVWFEAGAMLVISNNPLGLVPILLEPEEYIDPWLDEVNAFTDSAPLTRFFVCNFMDNNQAFCEERSGN